MKQLLQLLIALTWLSDPLRPGSQLHQTIKLSLNHPKVYIPTIIFIPNRVREKIYAR